MSDPAHLFASTQAVIQQALQTFQDVANISFIFVPGGGNADIMFGMRQPECFTLLIPICIRPPRQILKLV